MSKGVVGNPALADQLLAATLFAQNPRAFGGIVLRGYGPVRDRLLSELTRIVSQSGPVVRIPVNVDSEQLLGGLDLTASLSSGTVKKRVGLLERASGGVTIVRMAERISPNVAAHLAQAIDSGNVAVILLDDSLEGDEKPAAALLERAAFHCDVSELRDLAFELDETAIPCRRPRALLKKQRSAIAATAAALGINSLRALLFTEQCAGCLSASAGKERASDEELQTAVRLVLGPRAMQMPTQAEPPAPPAEAESEPDNSEASDERQTSDAIPIEDLLIEAAAAAIPQHVLDGIAKGALRKSSGQSGRSGQQEKSAKRGRPRGSLPGTPGDGRKIALIDTLRAAAPWQAIRRQNALGNGREGLHIRKSDLRIRQFEQNRESLKIFAVDASGSSALSRLAEAKGAVELMLAEVHVNRSQVALIAFRQTGAEILLPPTRSLTRARRALSALPGGGGTPLAAGLVEARLLADAAEKRGQTPTIALLTDGKANVTLAGEADRAVATQEVETMARGIAAAGHHSIVIDISPRPREEAAGLASLLKGKYLPLPHANSAAMVAAIESVGESAAA